MTLEAAITRLQAITKEVDSISPVVKSAPDTPVEDAAMLPMSIAHIGTGTVAPDDASTTRLILNVFVDVHFSLNQLSMAYDQINAFIPDYMKRLSGDPTLDSNTQTIVFPVSVQVLQMEWDRLTTVAAPFTVPLKYREAPTT